MAQTTAALAHQKSDRFIRWFGSRQAFVFMLLAFIIGAIWIAVSGKFPMAFDEDYHLGIIKVFSHHLSPFPTPPAAFGLIPKPACCS